MSNALAEALARLEVNNDNHWTAEGLPRLETLKILTGNPGLTRENVATQFPAFSRNNPELTPAEPPSQLPPSAPIPPSAVDGSNTLDPVKDVPEVEEVKGEGAPTLQQLNEQLADAHSAVAKAKENVFRIEGLIETEVKKQEEETPRENEFTGYFKQIRANYEQRAEFQKLASQAAPVLRELEKRLGAPIDLALKNRKR